MLRKRTTEEHEVVRSGDLIPDNRLGKDGKDLLEHEAIAQAVAEIALKADTPVNIALFGPWGSGKSSIYSMIEKHLSIVAKDRARIVRYDAWKYGGQELKRNFIESITRDLEIGNGDGDGSDLHDEQVRAKLDLGKWLRSNWKSLCLGLGLAVLISTVWVLLQAAAVKFFTEDGFISTAQGLITRAGTVFGLSLVAVLVGPKALEGAVTISKSLAPTGSDQFAQRFSDLVGRVLKRPVKRLVVFIDELDRCAPEDVVATLVDLKTFLDQEGCAFIVAADREVLESALRKLPQAKPVREDEPYYATPGAFLDKIFQHQIGLPPLRPRALTAFAHELADAQDGVWQDLRDSDEQDYELIIFALVPVHVRSPRRVKVLLNNFATTARTAEARGIKWIDRAYELAVLTVLQTEFPAVADELRRIPRLLQYIRKEETPQTPEIESVVSRFAHLPGQEGLHGPDREAPAGDLLADEGVGLPQTEKANETLRRHLSTYLSKVAAAGISDPRPDLLYLQGAAGRSELGDPRLGDIIDYASDTAPDEVVAAFTGATSAVLAIAVPLLVTEGDNAVGPGRRFAYESACRLLEHVGADDRAAVAAAIAPSLIAALEAEELGLEAQPGALLSASWSGASPVVATGLKRLQEEDVPDTILTRLSLLGPHLGDDAMEQLSAMLGTRYAVAPGPLLESLARLPIDSAIGLWERVESQVLEVLDLLEEPIPKPDPEPETAPTGAAAAPEPEPDAPEPTGDGLASLDDLVNRVAQRPDGEPLLSAVFESIQVSDLVPSFQDWCVQHADVLIRPLESSSRRIRHGLLGLRWFPIDTWSTWISLLPEAPPDDAGLSELAKDVLTRALLPALSASESVEATGRLETLVGEVLPWCDVDDSLKPALLDALTSIGWPEAAAEEGSTSELIWARKRALARIALNLDQIHPEAQMTQAVVADLAALLPQLDLNSTVLDNWDASSRMLHVEAVHSLSEALDAYEPRQGEGVAVLRLRLSTRRIHGGASLPASELSKFEPAELPTSVVDLWLDLSPSVDEVIALLGAASFTARALERYCDNLSTGDRTRLWEQLVDTRASFGLVRAAGRSGVDVSAIEHTRAGIRSLTREPDRSERVSLLVAATFPRTQDLEGPARKAASELAADLLDREVAGDLRSAVKVVIWAGGAGYGHTVSLREKFTSAVERHQNVLSRTQVQHLADLGMVTVRKRGRLAKFLGL